MEYTCCWAKLANSPMPWRRQPPSSELLVHWRGLGQALGARPATGAPGAGACCAAGPAAPSTTPPTFGPACGMQALQGHQPGALRNPCWLALALWYHDAIYWPWSGHNRRAAR